MSLDAESFRIRYATWRELEKSLKDVFSKSAMISIMYWVGVRCGQRSCQRILEQKPASREDVLKALVKRKREEGWGEYNIREINWDERRAMVVVENCFEAMGVKDTEPQCHFVRGYLGGFFSTLFEKTVTSRENACKAKGDLSCVFDIVPC